jgi:spore coat polysaccharide biosynthesis protein SpsF (cytidylyltransferase family)
MPGKALADIAGRSMLARVCDRLKRARLVDESVVATTGRPEDGHIVGECERLGVRCFRGSELDVLDRYAEAAERCGAAVVVRVTGDCPLIDPRVVDQVVRAFLKQRPDYAANILQRSWPRGLDTEAIGAEALALARREATAPHQRAHVTPYFYEHPERFRLVSVTGPVNLGDCRWTVDTPDDLRFVRAVYRRLGDGPFSWQDVRGLLLRQPSLAELNRHVPQKELVEG